ncbi:MAG: glycine cleavage system protein H [Chloroflexi bacterium RBG_13_56_8]|nr:MAG: glycine cleavage system protein H [Chloroflexi bacterium RBG_13_56_8]
MKVDPHCRYTKSHEWVLVEGDYAYAGITDYAQDQLSDIVYVEMPEVGDSFNKGEVFGVVESVKAASDVYLPIAGEIVEVNEELIDSPELVNQDPYGEGWFVKFAWEDTDELDTLMEAEAYAQYVESLEEGDS